MTEYLWQVMCHHRRNLRELGKTIAVTAGKGLYEKKNIIDQFQGQKWIESLISSKNSIIDWKTHKLVLKTAKSKIESSGKTQGKQEEHPRKP